MGTDEDNGNDETFAQSSMKVFITLTLGLYGANTKP
jgi:hypothetical protein